MSEDAEIARLLEEIFGSQANVRFGQNFVELNDGNQWYRVDAKVSQQIGSDRLIQNRRYKRKVPSGSLGKIKLLYRRYNSETTNFEYWIGGDGAQSRKIYETPINFTSYSFSNLGNSRNRWVCALTNSFSGKLVYLSGVDNTVSVIDNPVFNTFNLIDRGGYGLYFDNQYRVIPPTQESSGDLDSNPNTQTVAYSGNVTANPYGITGSTTGTAFLDLRANDFSAPYPLNPVSESYIYQTANTKHWYINEGELGSKTGSYSRTFEQSAFQTAPSTGGYNFYNFQETQSTPLYINPAVEKTAGLSFSSTNPAGSGTAGGTVYEIFLVSKNKNTTIVKKLDYPIQTSAAMTFPPTPSPSGTVQWIAVKDDGSENVLVWDYNTFVLSGRYTSFVEDRVYKIRVASIQPTTGGDVIIDNWNLSDSGNQELEFNAKLYSSNFNNDTDLLLTASYHP
jgi:hypothetical protein